jgi:hypothetical protein
MAINYAAIERGVSEAFGNFAKGQDAAYKAAIADNIFSWPNRTRRDNGELAGTTRNIVDSGEFRDSQSVQIDAFSAVYTWDADHAAYIFYGYTTGSGDKRPPRNWIKASHRESDPTEAFGREMRRVFN